MPNQKTVNYTDKARIEKSTFVAKGLKNGKWKRLEGGMIRMEFRMIRKWSRILRLNGVGY